MVKTNKRVARTDPKYSCQDPEGKPLVNELIEFFKITNKELPANKEK